ncbi:MAG: hypothetical protein MUC89_17420 [Acetobacteraceae bacterium]|nr:hypothetical protein [Acetobacteraceae bacterium]
MASLALLAACADGGPPPPAVPPRPLDYTYLTPLRLDVARVDVVEAWQPPRTLPNVDHRMAPEPRAALAQMARDRVQAWGREGSATVTITEASLTEERLARSSGITSLFASQPSERYTLNLAVVLEVRNAGGGTNGRAEARISRTRTVNDDVTLAQRERIWDEMLRAAMDDAQGMNVEFEFQVRRALRSVLVAEGTPRPNPSAVEVQDLGPPGSQPPAGQPPRSTGPRELTPATPQPAPGPAAAPQGLTPGPGGTPGMGTLGTIPVQR